MFRSRMTIAGIALLVLALLLTSCRMPGGDFPQAQTATPAPPPPSADLEGTITTVGVRVAAGELIAFEGRSTLPDGTVLETQLLADGAPAAWWPGDVPVGVEGGRWDIMVTLGEGGAPEELSADQQYALRVWARTDPSIEAPPYTFDVSSPPKPVTLTDPDSVTGPATVEEIDILLMESFPIQVAVVVKGYLPDGCTVIDQVRSRFEPESNRFVIEITTVRDADAVCTEAIVPFEERVALDVYGLPAGTYFVDANGVVDSFTFDVDNVPQEESGSQVPWDEARRMMLTGEVAQVTQLHSLQVTLMMKDGQRLVTYEPEIDDVVEVLEECGELCSGVVLATE